jgi:purine-nucleoside phosphorylase
VIYIAQCLCPSRHCIAALAFDPRDTTPEAATELLRMTIEDHIRRQVINPWCGLCHSRDFLYDAQPTRFKSMDEAKPYLLELERRQLSLAALVGGAAQN